MRRFAPLLVISGLALILPGLVRAEAGVTAGGRGGPFLEIHTNSISAFDPSVGGVPIVIGGTGYGYISKRFRVGGSGGGGFAWNSSNNTHFAIGYGGVLGEYMIFPWLSARVLLGGGGYDVEKVISQSTLQETIQRLGGGGFVLFYPSLCATIPVQPWLGMQINVGFFMPNDSRLQSLSISLGLLFGKG